MDINKAVAALLGREGKAIKVSDFAKLHNITTAYTSALFCRLCKMGIAKRWKRGLYILSDKEIAVNYLNTKHNKHNKRVVSVIPPTPDLIIRPHQINIKCRVLNDPAIKDWKRSESNIIDVWRRWDSSQYSIHYEKYIELESGIYATVRYSRGNRKRTITINIHSVMIPGNKLDGHLKLCREYAQEIITRLHNETGFMVASIDLTLKNHFGVPLPVESGYRLPKGIIPLNAFWWIDNSQGFPELETGLKEQMKSLVELSNDWGDFKGHLIEKIESIDSKLDNKDKYEKSNSNVEGYT